MKYNVHPLFCCLIAGLFTSTVSYAQLSDLPDSHSSDSLISSEPYYHMRGGLDRSYAKFTREKSGRVAFLGGSITHNPGWRDSVMHYLVRRFPDTEFEFIPAGIPSMGSTPGAFRLERDVLKDGPVDLLFEEAAVNDATNGRRREEQIRGMEGIVRHTLYANPSTDILLMYFVDPDKMADYRNGEIPEVIQNHEQVAIHYNLPSLHLAREVTDRIDAGEFTWEEDFKDLHPSPFGQGVYSRSIIGMLEIAWSEVEKRRKQVDNRPVVPKLPDKMDTNAYDAGYLIEVNRKMAATGWNFHPVWIPDDGAGTRKTYTNVPMLIGSEPGNPLRFEFTGKAVGIAVAAGPDAGTIRYRIDQGPWQNQDLFTQWSSRLHLPWYYTLSVGLSDGPHILEMKLLPRHHPKSTGTSCRIRYFYINR